jgi:hypothetical protein
MKIVAVAILFGLIAACATSSRAPVAAARTAGGDLIVDRTSKGTPARNVSVGADTAAPVVEQTDSEVANQNYVKSGYKVIHRNGQLLYCRSEAMTGSFFRSTVCKTDAEMAAAEQRRQNVVDELGKSHGGVCSIAPKC